MTRLGWTFRRRTNVDLSREIDAHIAERVDELIDDGVAPDEARAQARREFGNATLQIERSREVWGWQWLDVLRASARDAFRTFRRNRGTMAVCLLALGASTGLLAVCLVAADALVLRPIRLPGIERVVTMGGLTEPGLGWTFNQWWGQARALEKVTRWFSGLTELETADGRLLVNTAVVEPEFPELFRVRPLIGRPLEAADFIDGTPIPILINERMWRARFESATDVLGRTLTLGGAPAVIVGVLPASTAFPHQADAWATRRKNTVVTTVRNTDGGAHARLVDGATIDDARNGIDALATRLNTEHGAKTGTVYVGLFFVFSASNWQARPMRTPVIALLIVSVATVLVAVANAATLLLGAVLERRHEFAVRASLGASRRRIVGQAAFESMLAGAVAGLCGGVSGGMLLRLASPLLQPLSPHLTTAGAGWTVVGAGAVMGALLGLTAGLLPLSLSTVWKDWALLPHRGADRGSRRGRRIRTAFVVMQVAIAMALTTAAGVATQRFLASSRVSLGFDPAHVLAMRLMVPAGTAVNSVVETIANSGSDAGLVSATGRAARLPLVDGGGMRYIGAASTVPAAVLDVRPGFFAAMGIPLRSGRDFTSGDVDAAIVSETLAARMWPNASPLGQRLLISSDVSRHVIGVAADIREEVDDRRVPGMGGARFYGLMAPTSAETATHPQTVHLVMQCPSLCADAMGPVRSIAEATGATVMHMTSLQTTLDGLLSTSRLSSTVALACAAFGLLLSFVGIYGAILRVAAARTQEVTIRMALGATPHQVRRIVYRYGAAIVTTGVVIGAGATWLLLSAARPLLSGVSSTDPVSYAIAASALLSGGLLAGLVPALRLGRLDARRLLRE